MTVIDPHAHIVGEEFIREVRAGTFGSAISIEQSPNGDVIVSQSTILGQQQKTADPIPEKLYRMDVRFKDMDAMGVDRQILSIPPNYMFYGLEGGVHKEIAAFLNDSIAKIAKETPDRFSCLATVPLQEPGAAAAELERAVKMGYLGVQIGSNIAGKNLDDPGLDVFWDKVVALDVPVFIHPTDVMGIPDRLKEYHLRNLIGNPLDTSIAAACLMFGGVFDRFPKIKIELAHLGGYVPWIRGRWQHGYGEREEAKIHGAKDPESYVLKFYYDAVIHNADCFEFAVKTLGADRVLYGTDYPFDMGYHSPAREIPGLSRLSEADQEKILFSNAKALYRLP